MQCVVGAERTVPGLPGLAGSLTLTTQFPKPGWTAFQIISPEIQPDGIRNFTVRFPSGAQDQSLGLSTGVVTPAGTTVSITPEFVGQVLDADGVFTSQLTFVYPALEVDLAVCHVPVMPSFFPSSWGLESLYSGYEARRNTQGLGSAAT